MASPTLTRPGTHRAAPVTKPTTSTPSPRWPADARARALAALVLATPFLVVAIRAYSHHYRDSANAALSRQAGQIRWGSGDMSFVGHVYPPLPTAVAGLLPSAMALGVVGALAAGAILESLGHRLAARGYSLPVTLAVVGAFGITPSFAITATTDLAMFMALTLLVLALDGFLRFVLYGQTHGGFQAGLAIGLAGLCNPGAVVLAVAFALAAPLAARHRYRDNPAAGRATAAVLLFPTVAGLLGWTFLCWRFSDGPLAWLHRAAPQMWHGVGQVALLRTAGVDIARAVPLTPVFVLAVVLFARAGRWPQAAGIVLPLPCLFLAVYLGLPMNGLAIAAVLGVVGLTSLPPRPSRALTAVIVGVAVLGCAAKWGYPPTPAVAAWERLVGLR